MSQDLPSPVVLLKTALHAMPPRVLRPALRLLMRGMQRQHAPLFRRLTRIAPATILFDPVDTPHCFLLTIAEHGVRLDLATRDTAAAARISGELAALIQLLEGRVDSDTLFFSRAVTISGDTAVAVGFRNTLDGESISLVGDALGMAGPLAGPGRRVVLRLDRRIGQVRQVLRRQFAVLHRQMHNGRDLAKEHDALAADVQALRDKSARHAAGARHRLSPAT